MEHGDFTSLAKKYINRPAYNSVLLKSIANTVTPMDNDRYNIAEIGAGTGKLTKMLSKMGYNVFAVEPNDSMRNEGKIYTEGLSNIKWSKGTGEETGLDQNKFDWVIMASSFHWTDHNLSLPEFYRILKSNTFLTIIWNPRNIKNSKLHVEIEDLIHQEIPSLNRVSSGGRSSTKKWEDILDKTGHFKDVIYSEIAFEEEILKSKYIGAWESVNDIRVQAGEEKFDLIMTKIKDKISSLELIKIPYKNTAWTAKRID